LNNTGVKSPKISLRFTRHPDGVGSLDWNSEQAKRKLVSGISRKPRGGWR
jgi:hypothetical protein